MKKRSLVSGVVAMAMAASVFTGAGVAGVNFVSANTTTPAAVTSNEAVSGGAVAATGAAVATESATTTGTSVKKPVKVTKVKTTRKSAKKAVVTWKKIKGVAGYQVKYTTKKTLKTSVKGAKTVNVTKNTAKATIKGLKKNKIYYVKVRAYKKNGTKKVYGNYSKVVKIKKK